MHFQDHLVHREDQVEEEEEHRRGLPAVRWDCVLRSEVEMLPVGGWEGCWRYSGGEVVAGIALDVVFPARYVLALGVTVLLAVVVSVVCVVALRFRFAVRDRSPEGRVIDYSS